MFAFKNLRMVGVPQRSIHSGNMTLHSSLCDTSYSASVNVMVYPAGAILSSFHETRRPKPATPMTSSVIYKGEGRGARIRLHIQQAKMCKEEETYGDGDVHDVVHVDDLARSPLTLEEVLEDTHGLVPDEPVVPLSAPSVHTILAS